MINAGQKLLAASFVIGASRSFDSVLYTGAPPHACPAAVPHRHGLRLTWHPCTADGCDIGHLVQGVGRKGLTSLFSNLGILAWTVALADTVAMALPWMEHSPLYTFIAEKGSHELAHALLGAQKLLVRLLP